jgi:hypothetical protein
MFALLFPVTAAQLDRIETKVTAIMAQVAVEQDDLDTIGTELSNLGDAVQKLIDDPGNPLTAADLSVITEPLARIEGILPPQVNPE